MTHCRCLVIAALSALLLASLAFNVWQYREKQLAAKQNQAASEVGGTSVPQVAAKVALELQLKSANYYDWSETIHLEFNRILEEPPAAPGWITVSPETKFETTSIGGTLTISGDFKPGERYTITVKSGLKSTDGATLRRDAVAVLRIPNTQPNIAFAVNGTFFPLKSQNFLLPFNSTNIDKVKVALTRAYDNNLNPLNFGQAMAPVAEREISINAPKNQQTPTVIDLEKLCGKRPSPGVYRLSVNQAGSFWPSSSLLFTISDLALTAAADDEAREVAIFVRRFSDNTPVPGASVEALSENNQKVGSGTTGADGTVKIAYLPSFDTQKDTLRAILVRKDAEISYLPVGSSLYTAAAKRSFIPGQAQVMVFAERGVVRPGDKFAVSAFARQAAVGKPSVPAERMPLRFVLEDPRGNQISSLAVATGMNGFADGVFQLPPSAPVGNYKVRAELPDAEGSCFIAVADFIPDRIKVKVAPNLAEPAFDRPVSFTTEAEYYFGGKVDSGSFSGSIFAEPGPNPARWKLAPGWTVGDADAFNRPSPLEWRATTFSGVPPEIDYPGISGQGGKSYNPTLLVASVTVAEPGGNGVSAVWSQAVYPSEWFIALAENGGNAISADFKLRTLAARPESLAADTDKLIEFELNRVDWDYVLAKTNGRYHREWKRKLTKMERFNQTLILPGQTDLANFTTNIVMGGSKQPLPSGCYELTASCGKEIRTRLTFYHYSGDGSRPQNPAALVFATNAEKYDPGDTAEISFDSTADGAGLLVSGASGLDEVRAFAVKAGRNTVKVAIPAKLERSSYNAAISLVTGSGSDFNRAFDVVELPVDQTARHQMKVDISAPELAQPGDIVDLTIRLADTAGKNLSGTARVWAVDEGILALTGYRTPDIFARFFGKSGCGLSFYDVYGDLLPELKWLPDGSIGGDADAKNAFKGKFDLDTVRRDAAVTLPPVEIGPDGVAKCRLTLPDHHGAMRIFAVAAGVGHVGGSDRTITVRNAAETLVSAPRVFTPGDAPELVFTVFNHDFAPAEFKLKVALPPGISTKSPVEFSFDLAHGAKQTFTIPVTCDPALAAGTVSIDWDLTGPEDFRRADQLKIAVRRENLRRTLSHSTLLRSGESDDFSFAASSFAGAFESTCKVTPGPADALANSLEWLNAYPYGCLEQTAAAAFPFIMLDELVKLGAVDKSVADTNRHKLPSAVANLLAMRHANGSFGMWPGDVRDWREGGLFAAHFIVEAKVRGLADPGKAALGLIVSRLRTIAADASTENRPLRAYAVYILSLVDDDAFISNAQNILSDEQTDFASLLAAAALMRGGFAAEGAEAMRRAIAAKVWNRGGFPLSFAGNASGCGMTLYLMSECNLRDEAAELELAGLLSSMPRATTQDNAWFTLGMTAFAMQNGGANQQMFFEAEGVLRESSQKCELAGNIGKITNRSKGPIMVVRTATGIPTAAEASGGPVTLKREYLDSDRKAISSAAHGELVYVRLTVSSPTAMKHLTLCDLLPAGLEIEDNRLLTRSAIVPPELADPDDAFTPVRLEKRGDRYLVFGDFSGGTTQFVYPARATTRGRFKTVPFRVEAMYAPEFCGTWNPQGVFEIK